jgi:myo-inositol-1(or 4)-monophosphatase
LPASDAPSPGPTADLSAELATALAAVHEAGEIGLSRFRRTVKTQRKADGTPVTEVDLAIDALLRERLLAAYPADGWLSEEGEKSCHWRTCRRAWIVDPLDGTSGYLRGEPYWCVAVALAIGHVPVLGVIHAPALGHTWTAAAGKGAFLNGEPIRVSPREELAGAHIIGPRYIHDARRWETPWPQVSVTRLPSLALRLARVASADADGMIAPGHKSDWDIAAGDIIIREAGGIVTDARGEEIIYNREATRPFGVIAANPVLHGQLLKHMKTFKGHGGRKSAHKGTKS